MSNYWKQPGIPHKGWTLQDVIDVRADGQDEWETDYETCMMCGNEKIRYVHVVSHEDVNEEFRVGCICAEKMTNDYVNPKRKENELKNRAARRVSWNRKKWKRTEHGNHTLIFEEHRLLIFKDKRTGKYKCKVGEVWGKKSFDTLPQAKNAILNGINYLKEKDEW